MDFTIGVFVAALLVLVWLTAATNLLRARAGAGRAGKAAAHAGPKAPFSLGRLHMAWWTLIALASVVALAGSRHQIAGVLNPQTLLILAIAAATLIGASWIERAGAFRTQPFSGGFFTDLLCDHDGLCLHRLQLFVASLILGAAFVWTVATDASMPMFDGYTLAILAISGGTFVGFMGQESPMKTA